MKKLILVLVFLFCCHTGYGMSDREVAKFFYRNWPNFGLNCGTETKCYRSSRSMSCVTIRDCGLFKLNYSDLDVNPYGFRIESAPFSSYLSKRAMVLVKQKGYSVSVGQNLGTSFVSYLVEALKRYTTIFQEYGCSRREQERECEIIVTTGAISTLVSQGHLNIFNRLVDAFVYNRFLSKRKGKDRRKK